ncbi:MAG: biosynthetic-type acetolactate synthase large subunit [Lachnospiraceae bacterium]|nr:biosynthetic-type acetolactate synthase large subunit [Lachnospiraceae bacterium]
MNGANLLVKALETEGVRYVFGYPGVSICPFFDALHSSEIKPVLMRGEQSAGHAANGYARAGKTVGVCAVSSGPGATNLITAIATAFADSIPLICITGQVPIEQIGSDMFQEADILGAAESFVKYSYAVRTAKDIPRIVKEAFHIASTGRKGPVLIDFPVDVQNMEGGAFTEYGTVNLRTYKPTLKGHAVQIKKVLKVLQDAKRPILCVGGGVISSGAEEAVTTFAEKYNLPVVSTMMGIGVMKTDHPLYMGMVGNNGKKYANKAMNESDLLIMVGARVADRAVSQPDLITKDKILVHIDIDPAEIGKNAGPSIPIVGDAKLIFDELNKAELTCDFKDWSDRLIRYSKTREGNLQSTVKFVDPNLLVKTVSELLPEDGIYIADVGQNQIYSASNYIYKGGMYFTSGGMGTMGYSLPASVGAFYARPSLPIVCAIGDGAMQMVLSELGRIKEDQPNLKIIIMNNKNLGMIREYQHNHYDNRYTMVDLGDIPDYSLIAKAYGISYKRIKTNKELKNLEAVFADKAPWVIEVSVDSDAFCVN